MTDALSCTKKFFLAACLLICVAGCAHKQAADITDPQQLAKKFGTRLVADFDIPSDTVSRYNVWSMDPIDWTSPEFQVKPEDGPYTVVVTLVGSAKETKPASSLLSTGWIVGDSRLKGPILSNMARPNAQAGDHLVMSAGSATRTFDKAEAKTIFVSFVSNSNMNIESAHVTICSGNAPYDWGDLWIVARIPLGGALLLSILYFWLNKGSNSSRDV